MRARNRFTGTAGLILAAMMMFGLLITAPAAGSEQVRVMGDQGPPEDRLLPILNPDVPGGMTGRIAGQAGYTAEGRVENLLDGDLTTVWSARGPDGRVVITLDRGQAHADVVADAIWLHFDDLSRGYKIERILASDGVRGDLADGQLRGRGPVTMLERGEFPPTTGEGPGWVRIEPGRHPRRRIIRIFAAGNEHGEDTRHFNLTQIAVTAQYRRGVENVRERMAHVPFVIPDESERPTDYLEVSVDPDQMGLKEEPPTRFDTDIVVDQSGRTRGAHRTVSAGVEAAIASLRQGRTARVRIHPGIYRESLPHIIAYNPDVYRRFPVPEDQRDANEALRQTWLVIEGAEPGKVIISGADEMKEWTKLNADELAEFGLPADANVWSHPWPHKMVMNAGNMGLDGRRRNNAHTIESHRREMLFVNGRRFDVRQAEEFSYDHGGGYFGTWDYKGFAGPRHLDAAGTFAVADMGPEDEDVRLYNPRVSYAELYRRGGERPHEIMWARFEPGVNPNDQHVMVEAAVRENLFWACHKNNLVMRNLVFEKAAIPLSVSRENDFKEAPDQVRPYRMVMLGIDGDRHGNRRYRSSAENLRIESCVFRYSAGQGLHVMGYRHHEVVNSVFENNGGNPFGTSWSTHFLIRGNRMTGNNWRDAGEDLGNANHWEAGAPKVVLVNTAAFTDNLLEDNHGHGLWFDVGPMEILVERNILRNNVRSNLFLEISPGPYYIRNNVLHADTVANTPILHYSVGLVTRRDGRPTGAGGVLYDGNLIVDGEHANLWFTMRRGGTNIVRPDGSIQGGGAHSQTYNFAARNNIWMLGAGSRSTASSSHLANLGGHRTPYRREIMGGVFENNRYYHAHGGRQAFQVPREGEWGHFNYDQWQETVNEPGSTFGTQVPPIPAPVIEAPADGGTVGRPLRLTVRDREGAAFTDVQWFRNGAQVEAAGAELTFTPDRTGHEAVMVRVENEQGVFYLDQALIPVGN